MTDAEALELLRGLHVKKALWLPNYDADFSFQSEQDAIDYCEGDDSEITSFDVCAECARIEAGANGENTLDVGYETSLWPCRTAQTVLGVPA